MNRTEALTFIVTQPQEQMHVLEQTQTWEEELQSWTAGDTLVKRLMFISVLKIRLK